MSWSDLLRSAISSLFQHKVRSFLALIGVTLGSLLLFSSLAGGMGVLNAVNQRLSAGDRLTEIQVFSGVKQEPVTVDAARAAGITQEMSDKRRIRLATAAGVGGKQHVRMNLQAAEQLSSLGHVSQAWARIQFHATVHLKESDQWTFGAVGTIPPVPHDFSPLLVAGRDIDPKEQNAALVSEFLLYQCGLQTNESVAGALGSAIQFIPRNGVLEQLTLAKRQLQKSPESKIRGPDGKQLTWLDIKEQQQTVSQSLPKQTDPITIVGVYRQPTEDEVRVNPRLSIAADRNVLVPYVQASQTYRQLGQGNATLTAVVLADAPETVKVVERSLSELGYRTHSLSELALQIRTAVLLITAIITAIAGGALLISAIGITNTMIMNVMERRNEIAIMKAIGARDRDVNRLFLLEGMLIGIVGGALGLILGGTLSQLCGGYIRQLLEKRLNEPFGDEIFAYPIWLIIGTPLVAAAVTTLATYYPARRAAQLDPISALREL